MASHASSPWLLVPVNTNQGPSEAFSLSLEVVGPTAMITLRGRLDGAAMTDLGTLLDRVVDDGRSSLVVDLQGLELLAFPGLALLADAARRLAEGSRELSIRSPSGPIRRLLVAHALGDLIVDQELESTTVGGIRGDGGGGGDGGGSVLHPEPPPTPLALSSGTVSALPTDDDLIDATLRLVVELTRATVRGADGVSVSLRRRGRLATAAATDRTVLDMDAWQYADGEGPCVDASNQGRWFHTHSLRAEVRWPAFTPHAMALGIRSILSSPLVALGRPVGALNIYSRRPLAFPPDDRRLAMKFAVEISALLADAGLDASDDERSERFQASLRSGGLHRPQDPLATVRALPAEPGRGAHRLHAEGSWADRSTARWSIPWIVGSRTGSTGSVGTPA
jgi:anti-anti-sigma factor